MARAINLKMDHLKKGANRLFVSRGARTREHTKTSKATTLDRKRAYSVASSSIDRNSKRHRAYFLKTHKSKTPQKARWTIPPICQMSGSLKYPFLTLVA